MAGEKIMVVAFVLLVIFLGIIVFLIYIEKRLTSSEKKIKQVEEQNKKNEIL
jgi:preprotein translocase subunit SecG